MPNWYSGTVSIFGDITPFHQWYIDNKDTQNILNNSFAKTLAPLSTGKDKWSAAAYTEWGVKWDLSNISILSGDDENDEVFSFTFNTPWNSPIYLWKQIETIYNVEIEEFGYEEQQIDIYKYNKGRYIHKIIDNDWFSKNLNFIPSEEALQNEEILEDEKNDFRYNYWCDGMDKMFNSLSDDDPEWKDVIVNYYKK